MRAKISLLATIAFLALGCTPMVRFNNPSGTLPPTPREIPTEPAKQPEPRHEYPSHIDVNRMDKVIANYMTTPYQKGGAGSLGLDCSGFVYVVYRDYDSTRLPLTVQSLFRLANRVAPNELTYGDLVFFRTDGRKVSHVGIYLGENKFVHASETKGVTVDDLSTDYFASAFAGARRVE